YRDWDRLDCIAAPEDRTIELPEMHGAPADIWAMVATGHPTLLEVAGLDDPEAPDVYQPLLQIIEDTLAPLVAGGFALIERGYDDSGAPAELREIRSSQPADDPLIVILATRNAAVDDAHAIVDRLTERYGLADGVITASTVDRWQGQTNGITIGIHPLSGADE